MNAVSQQIVVPAIGAALAGGICLGHVFVEGNPFALIVPPKAVREHPATPWNRSTKRVDGAMSYFDGLANTHAMAEAGSELAAWALDQRIDDFADWFIGSRQDLLVIRGNLALAGEAFQDGGAESFEDEWYWSSAQDELGDAWAWLQHFGGGGDQGGDRKSSEYRAFVLRREPIR